MCCHICDACAGCVHVWVVCVFVSVVLPVAIPSTGQVGLGVGSWPSNRATEGSNPKGARLYFVILLKNVEKSLIGTDITV